MPQHATENYTQRQENHEKLQRLNKRIDVDEDKNISILPSEVGTVIMELRHRKRVGEYGILNKCLKLSVKEKVLPVTELFNTILE
jgi:hypothetical protein